MAFDMQYQHHSQKMGLIETVFIYFILMQPFLDILAYFQIPVSEVVRVLAMVVGIIYLLMLPNSRIKKYTLIYLVALAAFMVIHFTINMMVKSPFLVTAEFTYMIKTNYFIVMLIVYVCVIQSFAAKVNGQKTIQRIIYANMIIISAVILLAGLTGTGKRSYGSLAKEGHSGWFFSGNELSAILAMGFGIVILYMLQQDSTRTKLQNLPFIGLVIWAMLNMGTKVSFGAVIIVLGIAILIVITGIIRNQRQWLNVLILCPLLLGTVWIAPATPIGNNLNLTLGLKNTNKSEHHSFQSENRHIQQKLFSGRNNFLKDVKKDYNDAPMIQKIFGMGVGGNYSNSPKLIEMDFLDWFYSYGVMGFILLVSPLMYIGISILRNIMRTRFKNLNSTILLVGLAVGLGLGSAFVAGHVLASPASSIYLVILIAYLFVMTRKAESTL